MRKLNGYIEVFLGKLARSIARLNRRRYEELVSITVVVTCLLPCQPLSFGSSFQ